MLVGNRAKGLELGSGNRLHSVVQLLAVVRDEWELRERAITNLGAQLHLQIDDLPDVALGLFESPGDALFIAGRLATIDHAVTALSRAGLDHGDIHVTGGIPCRHLQHGLLWGDLLLHH